MSRRDKLLRRFLAIPADFEWEEMNKLMRDFGYAEAKPGRTSGSRVAFVHRLSGHIIRLHRPHPGKIARRYQIELVEEALRAKGFIK